MNAKIKPRKAAESPVLGAIMRMASYARHAADLAGDCAVADPKAAGECARAERAAETAEAASHEAYLVEYNPRVPLAEKDRVLALCQIAAEQALALARESQFKARRIAHRA